MRGNARPAQSSGGAQVWRRLLTEDDPLDLAEDSPDAHAATTEAASRPMVFGEGPGARSRATADLFSGPVSKWFGADIDGGTRDRRTLYAATPRTWGRGEEVTKDNAATVNRPLSFDISNNEIAATVDILGVVRSMAVAHRVQAAYGTKFHGVYVKKNLTLSRVPKAFRLRLDADGIEVDLPMSRLRLLGGLLPKSEFAYGPLQGTLITFAPIGDGGASRPRAVLSILELLNGGHSTVSGRIRLPSVAEPEPLVPDARAVQLGLCECVALLGDLLVTSAGMEVTFALGRDDRITIEVALLVGRSRADMLGELAQVRRKEAVDWLDETLQYLHRHLGQLSIPAEGYYAEVLTRQIELCRQSVLLGDAHDFVGGFWGSDLSGWPEVWVRDTYYQMLPMAWFAPDLCQKAILFFATWGLPPESWGRATDRFPSSGRVVHSVGNAVAAIALAGAYYQATGDRDFFASHSEVYAYGKRVLGELLDSRLGEPFLFPSLYISDGESAGDYHTGTNVLAWYAFSAMSRLAELYGDPAAGEWQEVARRIKADIGRRCVAEGPLGHQFFEGAYEDGSLVPGHDGEESDLTLAAVYQFCEADDPRLLNHARCAFTRYNPGYLPSLMP